MAYGKLLSFFSYLIGFIAVIAILVDDKKNKLYSFHIWQALLLNIVGVFIDIIYFVFYLPQKLLTIDVASRTAFFITSLWIPLLLVSLVLLVFGIIAYQEKYVKIALIGDMAKKISKYEVD